MFHIGTLNDMKKHMKGSYDMSSFGVDKHKSNESLIKLIYAEVKALRSELNLHCFHRKMSTVDLSEFFPLKSEDNIKSFMNREHEDWASRRNSFHDLLYNCIHENRKKFGFALLHLLFSRDYINNHKWPMCGG